MCVSNHRINGLSVNQSFGLITALIVLLLTERSAFAQSQVLDLTQLGGQLGLAALKLDTEEYFYSVIGPSPTPLLSAFYGNPGQMRALPTQGIDVYRFTSEAFQGRGVVSDFTNQGVFSVDYVGSSAPIPLSVESGDDFIASVPHGIVALPVDGDSLSSIPEERDQLYTRSILGGPATEITGGLPQFRELVGVEFSADGNNMVVGTHVRGDNGQGSFVSSKVFFATPGVTGLTPVLDDLHSGIRFLSGGSDTASEYHLIETLNVNSSLPGTRMWSVQISDPNNAFQLAVRPDQTQIGFDNGQLDAAGSRFLYSSREIEDNPSGQPSVFTIWSEALDGSTGPKVLAKLPGGREPFDITPVDCSPWIYVGAGEEFTIGIEEASFFALHSTTGELVEFTDPGGQGINFSQFDITTNGSAVVFTDLRTAGNDLYVGRPDATGMKQEVLWDVPDTDRLLRMQLSDDDQFVIATVTDATATDISVADRLVAIPLDGGMPIELDNGADAPEPYFIASSFFGPSAVGDQVFYLRLNLTDAAFYIVDLPTTSSFSADFDGDGDVDSDDLTDSNDGWLARYGNDLDGSDFLAWQQQFGSGVGPQAASQAVPEPTELISTLVALLSLLTKRR